MVCNDLHPLAPSPPSLSALLPTALPLDHLVLNSKAHSCFKASAWVFPSAGNVLPSQTAGPALTSFNAPFSEKPSLSTQHFISKSSLRWPHCKGISLSSRNWKSEKTSEHKNLSSWHLDIHLKVWVAKWVGIHLAFSGWLWDGNCYGHHPFFYCQD